jgi:hypothetical protein
MSTIIRDLHQDCLTTLNRTLDLVLKAVEAASADHNHKVVIQGAREATRIAALIFKMTNAKTTSASARRPVAITPAAKTAAADAGEPDIGAQDLILPDLDTFFPPHQVASWDDATKCVYETLSTNYREFQDLCDELAAGLPITGRITALRPAREADSAAAPGQAALKKLLPVGRVAVTA